MDNIVNKRINKRNIERIKTWIAGLDEKIEGGIPKGSTVLITGLPGVGKSIMLMHIIANNVIHNHLKSIYISVEQPREDIINQAWQFNWDFEKMEADGYLSIIALNSPGLIELEQERNIKRILQTDHYNLAAIDSLTSYSQMPVTSSHLISTSGEGYHPATWQELRRISALLLMDTIKREGITSFFTSHEGEEKPDVAKENMCKYRADCLIAMESDMLGTNLNRTLQIKKLRQTKIDGLPYSFDFTTEGITLKPSSELFVHADER